ncbi:metal-dependent hydrolase [Nocardioides sp. Kera G14]|uniref:metal-dependent hydrolase n=1 Tax=Nocardioides sp. Kera G14 TaxID=2884264 RepID=UPI001D12327C|nr:metal-dependent hydrolase [Nocardioides sp. Kera G14]UDY23566.1 metal-dependent hydrolase [Nocardioides sp. Kera G14]
MALKMPSINRLHEPAKVALNARDVHFDWTGLPLAWIPGEVFASHLVNVLHLLLPEGERWFVKVFSEALPLIQDEQLREEVIGFIGQEGVHASSHQGVLDYFDEHGLDTRAYVAQVADLFQRILGDRDLTGRAKEEWLVQRVSIVAAIEHLTAVLGNWVLNTPGLDAAGADETMLDLLRWHGAEEVEHRAVAYDVFQHLDGRYFQRILAYGIGGPALIWLWIQGVRYLMEHDTVNRPGRPKVSSWLRASAKGLTPGPLLMATSSLKFFSPWYHPDHEGNTAQAVAYLAKSPAALRADALAAEVAPEQ